MDRFQLVIVVFSTIFKLTSCADPPGGYYQTKYDALDVEEILNNKRLVIHYVNCLLDRGACPPQGADLKQILPEALETNCLRCTEKQKEIIVRTVRRLRAEYPILWSELVSEYDPNGEYFVRFVLTLDPTVQVEDQSNLLSNRFGDENFPSDLFPTTRKPTSPPTTTKKTRRTYHPTRSPTPRPTMPISKSTPRTTEPALTRTEEDDLLSNIFTTAPPLFNRFDSETTTPTQTSDKPSTYPPSRAPEIPTTATTTTTTTTTTTKPSTTTTQPPLIFGWRPVAYGPSPQAPRPPTPLVQSSVQLLSSLGQIGTRVIEAGSQVAGMVLNAFVGNN
uniref:Chemosensory protein 5 n=1 Tax=Photinus pyralis TaxID=7054 RepID=A0A1Y1JYC0_PHOPY